jgi:ketosteroid isomerase-like protein
MVKLQTHILEVENATKMFYEALQAVFSGDVTLMKQVWSHAEDVTYLGPQGGLFVGWQQVLNAWKEQAALKLQGSIEVQNEHFFQDGNIGISQTYEVGSNYREGKLQNVRIRATNIFRRENSGWKMISHHTDLLAFLNG